MENKFLKRIVNSIRQELPSFNDELLLGIRQNMIKSIPKEVEDVLRYLVLDQFPYVKYGGYSPVSPAELAMYIYKGKWSNVDIQDSNISLYKYNFSIDEDGRNVECPLYVFVPYLFEQEFTLRGSAYFPIFGIMDKAMIRIKNSKEKNSTKMYIGLEVPFILHKIMFYFNDKNKHFFFDSEGTGYEATVLKTKAHHKVKSKDLPPCLLYILAKYGYDLGLRSLGFDPSRIEFCDKPDDMLNYKYFLIHEGLFFKVKNDFIEDVKGKRILASLMVMFNFSTSTLSLEDLKDPSGNYFRFLLGKWIQKPDASPLQQINQANEHLLTIDRTVDYRAKANLHADGIEVNDFYELCCYLFDHIDELLVHKNNDLFHKKISITPQILYGFIRVLSGSLFNKSQSGERIKADVLTAIFKKVTRLLIKHIEKMSGVYMTHNDQSNDNWLLGIGAKKSRQEGLRDPFSSEDRSGSSPDGGLRSDLSILAHPSHLFVESILNLPASSPCKGGTINPFFTGVEANGLFFEPDNYKEFADIFITDPNQENPDVMFLDPDDPWSGIDAALLEDLEGDDHDEE